ncbi:hypothetical protein EJ110_NYTH23932 [Nymphaea thermarum]|nr:hypothetical protein EJ110_NYTH23932 [Nymphaea thermarum]
MSVVILVDTCASHSFMRKTVADTIGYNMRENPSFDEMMRDGVCIPCSTMCRKVQLMIQGDPYVIDLFILPICGMEVALGKQWLKTLGKITWDFTDISMTYPTQGSGQVTLTALKSREGGRKRLARQYEDRPYPSNCNKAANFAGLSLENRVYETGPNSY